MGWLIAAAVIGALGVFVAFGYNSLIALRNLVQESWAQIEVQLKRRHDLIPNLVETVKGYAAHERATFENVTQARAAAMAAGGTPDQARAESQLTQALFNLRAIAENYPELRASENFQALQAELAATEDGIASSRRTYNDTVRRYDTRRQSIPWNMLTGLGDFPPFQYFEADPDSRSPVKVEF
ncbi:MAG TPA: LemA family protein [Egibacteraceae bacterium]|nr:LemA family protein [Egibacteraceae bacterium]